MTDRKLVVIADSHLGTKEGDLDLMIRFLSTLDPSKTELLFLGDLFHIWAGPAKFHTAPVRNLMDFLKQFRSNNGLCYLVTGNRDVFFKEKVSVDDSSNLPFDRIAPDLLLLEKKGGTLLAIHGDTVNSKDLKYLRWRKMIRHRLFQLPFQLIPAKQVKKIMFTLERNLKKTNIKFRLEFPKAEWLQFLEGIHLSHAPKILLAGHFHPPQPIIEQYKSTTGIVLPDWCDNLFYLEVAEDLTYESKSFSAAETG